MGDYWHYAAVCPFFMGTAKTRIICENDTTLIFPDKEGAQEYLKEYCADMKGHCRCSYAKALFDYYERIENNEQKTD